jgi:hypothetical protein
VIFTIQAPQVHHDIMIARFDKAAKDEVEAEELAGEATAVDRRVNPKTQARVGRTVDLAVDTSGFHFFDKDTARPSAASPKARCRDRGSIGRRPCGLERQRRVQDRLDGSAAGHRVTRVAFSGSDGWAPPWRGAFPLLGTTWSSGRAPRPTPRRWPGRPRWRPRRPRPGPRRTWPSPC